MLHLCDIDVSNRWMPFEDHTKKMSIESFKSIQPWCEEPFHFDSVKH